jgi:hypothetical protein
MRVRNRAQYQSGEEELEPTRRDDAGAAARIRSCERHLKDLQKHHGVTGYPRLRETRRRINVASPQDIGRCS